MLQRTFCKSPDTFDLDFWVDPRMRGNCHGQGSCIQALKIHPEIDKLADLALAAKNKDATYVFTNVDMFADAKRFKKALKL